MIDARGTERDRSFCVGEGGTRGMGGSKSGEVEGAGGDEGRWGAETAVGSGLRTGEPKALRLRAGTEGARERGERVGEVGVGGGEEERWREPPDDEEPRRCDR